MASRPSRRDLDHVLAHTGDVWAQLRGSAVFITGGTGFVGSWLTESLVHANEQLNAGVTAVVLTRYPEVFAGKFPHLVDHPFLRLHQGDMLSFPRPEGEFPYIIHAATERYFPPSPEHPASIFYSEVEGTRHVLDFARSCGTRRFLFTSSGAMYGRQPPEMSHLDEEYPGGPLVTDPHSAYGHAKRISEFLCCMYARQYGFAAIPARLFAFSGPGLALDSNFAIGNFVRDVLSGGPIRIGGDGTPWRSYLYAADLAVWLWTLLVRAESGRPYNVGSGEALTIRDLAYTVASATIPGTRIEIAQQPTAGVPPARYVPSVERARRELGLTPLVSLKEGIRRMYAAHL